MFVSEAFNAQNRLKKVIDLREYLRAEKNEAAKLRDEYGVSGTRFKLETAPMTCCFAYVQTDGFFRTQIYFDDGQRLVTGRGMCYLFQRNEEISAVPLEGDALENAVSRMQLALYDCCADQSKLWARYKGKGSSPSFKL